MQITAKNTSCINVGERKEKVLKSIKELTPTPKIGSIGLAESYCMQKGGTAAYFCLVVEIDI